MDGNLPLYVDEQRLSTEKGRQMRLKNYRTPKFKCDTKCSLLSPLAGVIVRFAYSSKKVVILTETRSRESHSGIDACLISIPGPGRLLK